MSCRSWLVFQAASGQGDEFVRAFVARRVIEECRQTIPGFVHGELLRSASDPDRIAVTVEWTDLQSQFDWLASPVRAAQGPDLAGLLASAPQGEAFRCVHAVRCP